MEKGFLWAAVLVGLFLFGIAYNWLVARLAVEDEGYTAAEVVGGVGVTVAASAVLIGFNDAVVVVMCFVASGLPMIIGGGQRALKRRRKDKQQAQLLVKELLDDQTESRGIHVAAGTEPGAPVGGAGTDGPDHRG